MDIGVCIKKIDRHIATENAQPLIVDVQNRDDLSDLISHYNVSGNVFIKASQYCKEDEFPHIETLIDELSYRDGRIFVIGLTAFLKLQGEQVLRNTLREILGMSPNGHVIVITFQCRRYLDYKDPRLKSRVVIVEGTEDKVQSFVFLSPDLAQPHNITTIDGIHRISDIIQESSDLRLYVRTKKHKQDYPNSIYSIEERNSAYDVLTKYDSITADIDKGCGTIEQWNYALNKLGNKKSWADLIDEEFGNHVTLDIAFSSFKSFDDNKQWLYFIALKLFGAKNNWCLNTAAGKASTVNELAKQIYRSLLEVPKDSPDFAGDYQSRKALVEFLTNSTNEVIEYCKIVQAKGKDAIYYLTDNTQKEKELIFSLLDKYAEEYSRQEVYSILNMIYPELYQYLSAYRFKNELLDNYFQSYKYQKVINRVLPVFEEIVKEQAVKREYKLILEPRSSKIESINRTGAQLYFVDAMGAEYLSYIMYVCSEIGLMAKVTVCSCELPSITSKNKEFLELFENNSVTLQTVSIKDLDDIKHHGKDNYDYQQTKLPIHLIKELEIIRELLEKIRDRLANGTIDKAVLVSDHGASRLAVIHETESIVEMSTKGEHSGRCCLKTDTDKQPEYATDAGEFWALANYDRFKGGRKANVEVHGGATLEEVTVPIIELTYLPDGVEVQILSIDGSLNNGIPEITVSYRKKAEFKLFATMKLQDVTACIAGKFYDAVPTNDGFFMVKVPDIKHAGTYKADVYACGNCIAKGLQFIVKNEGQIERDIL